MCSRQTTTEKNVLLHGSLWSQLYTVHKHGYVYKYSQVTSRLRIRNQRAKPHPTKPQLLGNMASRGERETERLRRKVEDQLQRLLQQLKDLEEFREDLDEDEYEETKVETFAQLEEFRATLRKLGEGDMSLVNDFGRMQLAIQAAISQAFRTPEVVRMFAKRQPDQLRERLYALQRERKLGNLVEELYQEQAAEVLAALTKLGEQLQPDEEAFLKEHQSAAMQEFVNVDEEGGRAKRALSQASSDVKSALS